MIKYSLVCEDSHEFETWFRSGADFDDLSQRNLVECPTCGSAKVSKAIMAPSVARRDRGEAVKPGPEVIEGGSKNMVLLDENSHRIRTAIKTLHQKIEESTVDVGDQFVDQARRMHDGELPSRAIRGQATSEEARALWESGVPVLPIPNLPDEQN